MEDDLNCPSGHMAEHPQNDWGTVRYDPRFDLYWMPAGGAKQQLFFYNDHGGKNADPIVCGQEDREPRRVPALR